LPEKRDILVVVVEVQPVIREVQPVISEVQPVIHGVWLEIVDLLHEVTHVRSEME
jgi:hypothetical protein